MSRDDSMFKLPGPSQGSRGNAFEIPLAPHIATKRRHEPPSRRQPSESEFMNMKTDSFIGGAYKFPQGRYDYSWEIPTPMPVQSKPRRPAVPPPPVIDISRDAREVYMSSSKFAPPPPQRSSRYRSPSPPPRRRPFDDDLTADLTMPLLLPTPSRDHSPFLDPPRKSSRERSLESSDRRRRHEEDSRRRYEEDLGRRRFLDEPPPRRPHFELDDLPRRSPSPPRRDPRQSRHFEEPFPQQEGRMFNEPPLRQMDEDFMRRQLPIGEIREDFPPRAFSPPRHLDDRPYPPFREGSPQRSPFDGPPRFREDEIPPHMSYGYEPKRPRFDDRSFDIPIRGSPHTPSMGRSGYPFMPEDGSPRRMDHPSYSSEMEERMRDFDEHNFIDIEAEKRRQAEELPEGWTDEVMHASGLRLYINETIGVMTFSRPFRVDPHCPEKTPVLWKHVPLWEGSSVKATQEASPEDIRKYANSRKEQIRENMKNLEGEKKKQEEKKKKIVDETLKNEILVDKGAMVINFKQYYRTKYNCNPIFLYEQRKEDGAASVRHIARIHPKDCNEFKEVSGIGTSMKNSTQQLVETLIKMIGVDELATVLENDTEKTKEWPSPTKLREEQRCLRRFKEMCRKGKCNIFDANLKFDIHVLLFNAYYQYTHKLLAIDCTERPDLPCLATTSGKAEQVTGSTHVNALQYLYELIIDKVLLSDREIDLYEILFSTDISTLPVDDPMIAIKIGCLMSQEPSLRNCRPLKVLGNLLERSMTDHWFEYNVDPKNPNIGVMKLVELMIKTSVDSKELAENEDIKMLLEKDSKVAMIQSVKKKYRLFLRNRLYNRNGVSVYKTNDMLFRTIAAQKLIKHLFPNCKNWGDLMKFHDEHVARIGRSQP